LRLWNAMENNAERILQLLERCRHAIQDPIHHPEGSVLNHSLQVLSHARRESDDPDLWMAALLHDVGKPERSHGHENIGAEMIKGLVSDKVVWLVKNHMRYWRLVIGEMRRPGKVRNLIENPWFPDLALLGRWDKMGRDPNRKLIFDRDKLILSLDLPGQGANDMDISKEIDAYALHDDKPALWWLFKKYHMASQWRFVAKCTHERYGPLSYQTRRVWAPTDEGRILYEHGKNP